MRIGFVVSEFNYDITGTMEERAKAHAEFLGATVGPTIMVPGVFDMPLAIKNLLAKGDIDGVVCIGAVIEGETEHDEVVISHAARKMADLALEFDKPVGLGVTGRGSRGHKRVQYLQRGATEWERPAGRVERPGPSRADARRRPAQDLFNPQQCL